MRTLTVVLAGIFIAAGMSKWIDPFAFQTSVLHLDLFPGWMAWPIGSFIPLIEVLAGLLCLTVRFGGVAIQFLFILTLVYSFLLVIEWLRGIEPGCGCFGPHSAHWPYWALLSRNLGLLIMEAFLILATPAKATTVPGVPGQTRARSQ